MPQVNTSTVLLWFNSTLFLFSDRHDSDQLKKIAMEKLRKNQELLRDSAFMKKLNQNILIELFKEFMP